MKILLMGNPNVGKSVIFSRLTGVKVIASNYPGTTVSFTRGYMRLGDKMVEVIDAPGTYTLEPTCKAEEVALQMLAQAEAGDVVINVIDATNLERNLNLTLQLLERHIPMVVALNLWDDAKHKGITIDVEKLEELLNVPVVPTVAVSGEGISTLARRMKEARINEIEPHTTDERWADIGNIVTQVQSMVHRHHTFLETLEDLSLLPITGLPIAAVVIWLIFKIVRFIGEGLIGYIFDPLFEGLYAPLMMQLSALLGGSGFWHDIVIGKLIEGEIDFTQSFGLLTTGLYVPLAMVLPYVFAFYLMLGLLEDFGYLPRLAVLVDNLMHKLGLHGQAIVPTILGLGCSVPGMLSARILETRRERFIALTLLAVAVPCTAQSAMIIGLVGEHGGKYVAIVFGTLSIIWVLLGFTLNKIMRGLSPELLLEIPSYHLPRIVPLSKKLWMRLVGFLKDAIPFMLLGILLMNILFATGAIDVVAKLLAPVITNLMGLPASVVVALITGFLRKDVAVGMLAPLDLTAKQLTIASTVLAVYFPCIAAFVVLLKELGIKDMLKSAAIMLGLAVLVGTVMNLILSALHL
ncbi:TPA: ferrous iron transporter B [Candidatus Poribacteria bacterium]|nr:ferrous iron transporter B [Candidatus Poribacteria bacterium]